MEKKQCLFAKGALGHSLTLDLVAIVHFRLENPADSSLGSLEIGMPAVSILFFRAAPRSQESLHWHS